MNALTQSLEAVQGGRRLSREQARATLTDIFSSKEGPALDREVAQLLTALAGRGETVEEVVGFAEAMRAHVAPIGLTERIACVDTCGTGGAARQVFNISTAAAFAAAGAGARVAKHGNRTSHSVSGSADVLETVGVNLAFPAAQLGACLRENGIAFFFAPALHPAMRAVRTARQSLPFRTIFNLLGPLTNPAGADAQVIGVTQPATLDLMAEALAALGTRHSFVVYSEDGLGEFSTAAENQVAEIRDGGITKSTLDARALGIPRPDVDALECPDRTAAVAQLRAVLTGDEGPLADITALNAAAALVAFGAATDFGEGLRMAYQSLASRAAANKLQALIGFTQERTCATSTM